MDCMDAILSRRSIRKFTGAQVPADKLERVLQAGLLAPSSMNRRPCTLYLVRDRQTLARLSEAKRAGSGFLSGCACAIAVVADAEKADTWVEDCSIAMTMMWLAATSEGVGCCWVQMRLRSSSLGKNAEATTLSAIGAPAGSRLVGVLGLGMPAEFPEPRTPRDVDLSEVHGWNPDDA